MYVFTPLERAWHFRELIRAVVRRELAVRFRGTALGWIWAIFGPLVMLSAYTVIFTAVVGVPNSASGGGPGAYTISIFTGLIVFNLFSELAYRSPELLHEHSDVIKRSIFPSETLAWTATIRACAYAGISFGVLLVFELVLTHSIPLTALLLPFVLIPLFLFLLGMSWFLMALGCFTRDITYLMVSIVPVLMFVTPIFYSNRCAAQSSDRDPLQSDRQLRRADPGSALIWHLAQSDSLYWDGGGLASHLFRRLSVFHALQGGIGRCPLR